MISNVWNEIRHDLISVGGLFIVSAVILAALATPYLNLPDPYAQSTQTYAPPSRQHLLGTDHLGREILSGIMWGSRISLVFGLIVALISGLIGTLLGMVAGYYGGIVDDVLARLFEVFLAVPALLLIIVVVALFGPEIIFIMVVVGVTIWPSNAKIMRAQVLSLKQRDYVTASIATGATNRWVLVHHLIPNGINPVIANSALQIASAILLEAGLSFLGLGDPNIISWGRMLYIAQNYYFSAWWMAVFPGLCISATVLAFNVLADALNRALAPR